MIKRTFQYLAGVAFLSFGHVGTAMSYESAFSKTPVDTVEVQSLPAGRVLLSETEGDYFTNSGKLFNALFDYIKTNDISMTIPVEGDITTSKMRFYIGNDAVTDLKSTESVQVKDVPERLVVSIGARGSYTQENIEEAVAKLRVYLASQQVWRVSGEPYAVFWNGPFMPGLLKRFDVHIPIVESS